MTAGRHIVVAGEMVDGATAPAIAQGFREVGWNVRRVDLTRFLPAFSGPVSRVANRLILPASVRAYNRGLASAAEESPTAIVLIVKGTFVARATIARLKSSGSRVVLFYPDVEFDHPGLDPHLPELCDLVFTTKSFHLESLESRLGKDRVRFVHHGFDPLIHRDMRPQTDAEYDRDVVFIGNYSRYKLDFLAGIAEAGTERIEIMGGGWQAASGEPVGRFASHRIPVGDDYVSALARSRIAIALHHGPVRTPGWEDLVSTRSFEIPASGAMMLHIDNPQIRTLFAAGSECATFANGGELVERIRHFLAHPDERRAIAQAGHERALRDHSYWKRVQSMTRALNDIL